MVNHPKRGARSLKERSFAQWPEDAVYGGTQNTDALNERIWTQYLSVLSLFGRVLRRAGLTDSDRASVEQAYVDANVVLRRKGVGIYYERCAPDGYSAFEDKK